MPVDASVLRLLKVVKENIPFIQIHGDSLSQFNQQ